MLLARSPTARAPIFERRFWVVCSLTRRRAGGRARAFYRRRFCDDDANDNDDDNDVDDDDAIMRRVSPTKCGKTRAFRRRASSFWLFAIVAVHDAFYARDFKSVDRFISI